jgi:hypothetical protein
MTGPMGSGLPQFGFPRRLAILNFALPLGRRVLTSYDLPFGFPESAFGFNT